MAKTRRVKFELNEHSLVSLERLREQGAFVMSDSSDCSTSTGATVELISAASHYVDLARKGLTPYIRENGRHGKTSAWAELVQAVDDYQKSGGA